MNRKELEIIVLIYNNMLTLSSKSKETIEEAILKLVEETGELSSCYLKEKNPEHLLEEACDILQASFKLAYLVQAKNPDLNIFEKLLEKNQKWKKSQM